MIVKCHVCNADPCGRWRLPPACIFIDPYRSDGGRYACRDHLTPKREEEIRARERDHWLLGALR